MTKHRLTPKPERGLSMFSSGDIIALAAIAAAFLILFVPIVAWTTRHMVRDITSAISDRRGRNLERLDENVRSLARQVEALEARVEGLEAARDRLGEANEFDRRLKAPEDPQSG